MRIEKTGYQGNLSLRVIGRLDTNTAPQLEKAVEGCLGGVCQLTVDFSCLEYISSAGLRVLLSLHKTMKSQGGNMVVKGANEEVREVFNITGFTQILTVED